MMKDDVIRRYVNGETAQSIADEHGISRRTVYYIVEHSGIIRTRRKNEEVTAKRRASMLKNRHKPGRVSAVEILSGMSLYERQMALLAVVRQIGRMRIAKSRRRAG